MQYIAEQDWAAKRTLVERNRDHTWELALTDDETTLRKHCESIFNKQKPAMVQAGIKASLGDLAKLYK